MGAGILPIAEHNGKLYFLFGKETFDDSGQLGWADFGGGKESQDTSVFDTAVREGAEELNGFLGYGKTLYNKVKKNMIHVEKTKHYTVYIFSMDYNKDLPLFYNNHFRFISRKLPEIVKQHNGLLEKSHIKWFSFDDMWREKKNFRRFYQPIIDRILDNEDVIIKSFANKHK
jgi:hypothetical protein